MEWLAVASARTPSVAATTCAETTSQTLASERISGAVCRSSSVRARAARSGMADTLSPAGGTAPAARSTPRSLGARNERTGGAGLEAVAMIPVDGESQRLRELH